MISIPSFILVKDAVGAEISYISRFQDRLNQSILWCQSKFRQFSCFYLFLPNSATCATEFGCSSALWPVISRLDWNEGTTSNHSQLPEPGCLPDKQRCGLVSIPDGRWDLPAVRNSVITVFVEKEQRLSWKQYWSCTLRGSQVIIWCQVPQILFLTTLKSQVNVCVCVCVKGSLLYVYGCIAQVLIPFHSSILMPI